MHKVSAIIPTYNRAQYISECIDSILRQTYSVAEILLIDDGSTDNTKEILQKYDGKVRYFYKENGGKSSALNYGLSKAEGDYIWICDDDDYAADNALEALINIFEEHQDIDIALGSYKIFSTEGDQKHFKPPYFFKREEEPNLKINFLETMFTNQFAMLVKKQVYDEVGEFNEELIRSQDYEMTLRIFRHHNGFYSPDIIYFFREHDGVRGSSKKKYDPKKAKETWLEFSKKFFVTIAHDYSLNEFTPTFALKLPDELKDRASYIQKSVVLAKKGLWQEAIDELEKALKCSSQSLSSEEENLLDVVVRVDQAWQVLKDNPAYIKRLRSISASSDLGMTSVVALCRQLLWLTKRELKSRNILAAISNFLLMYRLIGFKGVKMRITKSLKK